MGKKGRDMCCYYVAECMEFTNLGKVYRNLTLIEAVQKYRSIPPELRSMIPGIGITIKTDDRRFPEEDCELVTGRCLDLDVLALMPYAEHPLVKAAVRNLQECMPELKVIEQIPSRSITGEGPER